MGQKLMAAPVRGKKLDKNSKKRGKMPFSLYCWFLWIVNRFLYLEKQNSVRFGMSKQVAN